MNGVYNTTVPAYYVENFGCRATQADGAVIERDLLSRGFHVAAAGFGRAKAIAENFVLLAQVTQKRFPVNQRHREFLAGARKYRSPYIWTLLPRSKKLRKSLGSNVAMMAREVDLHEKMEGLPVKWEFDYDWIYFWTSQYVHSTAWALNSHGVGPKEAFRVHPNERIEAEKPSMALFNSAVYLLKLMVTVYRGIGHEQPEQIMGELMAFLKRLK